MHVLKLFIRKVIKWFARKKLHHSCHKLACHTVGHFGSSLLAGGYCGCWSLSLITSGSPKSNKESNIISYVPTVVEEGTRCWWWSRRILCWSGVSTSSRFRVCWCPGSLSVSSSPARPPVRCQISPRGRRSGSSAGWPGEILPSPTAGGVPLY